MLTILIFLNAHNLPIFQPILMILVSKFMVHRALSDKTYLSLGLLSPLNNINIQTLAPCGTTPNAAISKYLHLIEDKHIHPDLVRISTLIV